MSPHIRRRRYTQPEWDGIARYHDGTPIAKIKPAIEMEMACFDAAPDWLKKQLREEGGIALEHRPPMTGMPWR